MTYDNNDDGNSGSSYGHKSRTSCIRSTKGMFRLSRWYYCSLYQWSPILLAWQTASGGGVEGEGMVLCTLLSQVQLCTHACPPFPWPGSKWATAQYWAIDQGLGWGPLVYTLVNCTFSQICGICFLTCLT